MPALRPVRCRPCQQQSLSSRALRAIAAADFSPDALFSLFECLAVLVHLRKLAHPAIPLDDAEEELLFQFEHSGEWLPDDLTLVAHWYWRAPAVLLGS